MPDSEQINPDITVGMKLDIGFSEDWSYRELFGGRNVPDYLAESGFASVETPVGLETDGEALKEHVVRCRDAGLKVSLHAYSEGTDSNPAFFSEAESNACKLFHERFLIFAAEAFCLQQSPTLVNIHSAAAGSEYARRDLVDRSVSFFSWARKWCNRNAPQVEVVAELQISPGPEENIHRIGDTYDELLEVVTRNQIRACWDLGHAYLNHRRYGVPLYPPEGFLRRVGHVHCHDVCGDDHQPLVYDAVPWKQFIRVLIDSGFDGCTLLEVPPSSFISTGGIQSLTQSLDALKDQIRRCERGRE